MRGLLVFLASLVVVVSGCAGGPAGKDKSATSSEPSKAATPTHDDDTGSITGNVTDEELQPIQGAKVGITRTDAVATSDTTGAYTLNKLQPGSYSLFVDALGFKPQGKKIDVVAGQIAHADFILAQIETFGNETFLESWNRIGFINADQTWPTYVYHDILKENHTALCGDCVFTLKFPPGGKEFMTEFGWSQTGVPGYNDGVHVGLRVGTVWGNHEFCWHAQGNWTDSGSPATLVPLMAKGTPAEFTIESSFGGFSFQHKVEMWTTVGYGEEVPDEFSAFPPSNEKPQDPSVCIVS